MMMNEKDLAKKIVCSFTREWLDHNARQRDIIEVRDWETMAVYGMGFDTDYKADTIYDLCQSMAEQLFSIPGIARYSIPNEWYDTEMGALWAAAFVRSQGDSLISIAEAARIAGINMKAMSARVARGSVPSYRDPLNTGRKLVKRSDIEPT